MTSLKIDLTSFINDDYYTLERIDSLYNSQSTIKDSKICDSKICDSKMGDYKTEDLHRRRWSFSIPNTIVAPPPSPPLSPCDTPRVKIIIPEEKPTQCLSIIEQSFNMSSHFNGILLISSTYDNTSYSIPTKQTKDARKLWRSAKIPYSASAREIETKLIEWAFKYAQVKIVDDKIKEISWM
jgi:hypothetical protein